jgi:hypothetical protein
MPATAVSLAACSFGWLLVAGADLFWEKSTIGWLLVVGLFWEKSTVGWWLISQANMADLMRSCYRMRGKCGAHFLFCKT